MKPGQHILIHGTNWIGDAVMSLAALRELRRLYPEHHLSLLVTPWVSGLFEGQAIVDEIIPYPINGSGWRDLIQLRDGCDTSKPPSSFKTPSVPPW